MLSRHVFTVPYHLPASRQRGLSLVELMVGVAVGLLVVAAAAMLTATQLGDNRRLLLETQVQQDLRAAMDTITREVRRSGMRVAPSQFVWTEAAAGQDAGNVDDASPLVGFATQIDYRYFRYDFQGGQGGFRKSGTTVQFRMPAVNVNLGWQDITDSKALSVTTFTVSANHRDEPLPGPTEPQRIPCPKLCPLTNDTSCWPVLKIRRFDITLTGAAVSDPAVVRTLRTTARIRNDQFVPAAAGSVCPS